MEQLHNIRLNDDLIAEAQLKLNNYGIDVNKVISDYLEKIIKEDYIPDAHTTQNEPKLSMADLCGIFKGKLWTSDDFDEPLDDLKEYMEWDIYLILTP